jgi:hypothetical protein
MEELKVLNKWKYQGGQILRINKGWGKCGNK